MKHLVIEPDSALGRLRLRSLINANSWTTSIGGSVMAPAVLRAMAESSQHYVDMSELNLRAGAYLAQVTGSQRGLVTAGGSAALVLQAAACLTGPNEATASRLPDVSGFSRTEIVIQKSHRNRYDGAYKLAGATLVEIGVARTTALWELETAITQRTAAVAYVFAPFLRHPISLEETIAIAHGRGVPVIVDAAAELPPAENLCRFIAAGADLVAFSGGKGLAGPQNSGILVGREDLIEAAIVHSLNFDSPHAGIGRPMKASRESIVGLVEAVRIFVARDHVAQWNAWRSMAETIVACVPDLPGVRAVVEEEHRQGPQAVIYFDRAWTGASPARIQKTLEQGDPPIYIGRGGFVGELYAVAVNLRDGEAELVGERLGAALVGSRDA